LQTDTFLTLRRCDFAVYISENQFTAKAQRGKEKIFFTVSMETRITV